MKNVQTKLKDKTLFIPSHLLKKITWNALTILVDTELIIISITKKLVQKSGVDKQKE